MYIQNNMLGGGSSNMVMTDDQADGLALASSFREASDDDIRSVMNHMSSEQQPQQQQQQQAQALTFYIVAARWFVNAFFLLTARTPEDVPENWRDQIGRITNAELIVGVEQQRRREVSSDDEEQTTDNPQSGGDISTSTSTSASPTTMPRSAGPAETQKRRFEQMHQRMIHNREDFVLKPGLEHTQDYFFLGPNAWMLVKEKFDFDGYELQGQCVRLSNNTNTNTNTSALAIQLPGTATVPTLIPIPASGRFPYESVIPKTQATTTAAMEATTTTAMTMTNIVPEEDDDDGTNESSFIFVQPPDETTKSEEESPIFLLPPSTTPTTDTVGPANQQAGDSMEVDGSSVKSDSMSVSVPRVRNQLASGLGNLGNTCFMNSSLQCLAHTEPLRNYFLSGEYKNDLNRDNPLGTGGELATQFARLLAELWGLPVQQRRSVLGNTVESQQYSNLSNAPAAVYPRNFKFTLGKHAEQFVGYDQHDSQELATYLLDALHEDTNRVTKKPYVEKPEQGEDEPDDLAADRAWDLHLQREDSRVLENFMGQVKSRLECCREDCNRVSTTFDPFMYLSVPIPGATDRKLNATFVPLDSNTSMKNMTLTLNKNGTMRELMEAMNDKLIQQSTISEAVPLEDLCAADVWSHEIFSWYEDTSEIDRIRDSDHTFIYQVRTLAEVQEAPTSTTSKVSPDDVFGKAKRTRKFTVDLDTMTRLNKDDEWQIELEKYVRSPTLLFSLFNAKRGTDDERMQFHKKLDNFMDICHKEITEEEDMPVSKRSRGRQGVPESKEEGDNDEEEEAEDTPALESLQGLIDRSDLSSSFRNVKSRNDVAILEFCLGKLRQFILRIKQDKKDEHKDGILVQVIMRRPQGGTSYSSFVQPLVMRIPATTTVYGFRELLAKQIGGSINTTGAPTSETGESSSVGKPTLPLGDSTFGSAEMVIMRQVALAYDRKSTYGTKANNTGGKKLGMLLRDDDPTANGTSTATLAQKSDEAEEENLAEIVGQKATIYVDWPQELCNSSFNATKFDEEEDLDDSDGMGTKEKEEKTSVLDCIEKYCQMEQLEDTEMWYCNRCKDHVRAWKQFHLYRAPPILIVHLKRFHYSATTHRRDKITSFIDFPLEGLDLTNLVSQFDEGKEPIYDCYAVSNHYGGLGGGHYTAYILSDDGTWSHYDDSRVSTNISTSEVLSEAAYVLYYRRKDVPVGQDLVDTSSAVIVEQTEASEISSNSTPHAVEDDGSDIMAVDGDGSSRTCSSPIGSLDGETEEPPSDSVVSFDVDAKIEDDSFLRQ